MHALRWTLPVTCWSVTETGKAEIGFIEPMMRRRLSSLSGIALKVAHDCLSARQSVVDEGLRIVFGSRHGELKRTTEILLALSRHEPVSPTAFSLSVLNAMTGVLGIALNERAPACALSAGAETLGLALLEAHAQLASEPSSPVLVVYADEQVDPLYGAGEQPGESGALAVLLDEKATQQLECTRGELALSSVPHASFATQIEAFRHCLEAHTSTCWQAESAVNGGGQWSWSWHA
ncbi:beta-ketoacyl synthase chain length factor [Paraburkholderia bonniea]|uniref:beta-ketoacyl synthase chain length factor n=1 Tax=Paraburkholderia bonniea TaxID=2152891 RepID=UPI001290D56E|nr:beta-ketoacyl synthase chain length factor [Paraburkholderia bonniea]WJF91328.1 beta-ketoacyl synthase chain length factor [Paraburkholderia bonniea]WJF94643.1 beta-ketoacyl synthase chain length factor [Paraburkholderia bonniea]